MICFLLIPENPSLRPKIWAEKWLCKLTRKTALFRGSTSLGNVAVIENLLQPLGPDGAKLGMLLIQQGVWLMKSEPDPRTEKGFDLHFSFDDLKVYLLHVCLGR